jgi:aromatic ring hydroxylase
LAYRHLFWSLSTAMAADPSPWVGGAVLPNYEAASAYHVFAPFFYSKVKHLIEESVTSGLIYIPSSTRDFKNSELRPYLDKYVRGSGGYDAERRVKLMKLLWDAIGTEFGGRHELYEINYAGSTEENRLLALKWGEILGIQERMKAFVETCMGEYDLEGWTVPDLINPDDVSWFKK